MSIEDQAQDLELKIWEANNMASRAPASYAPDDPEYGPDACEECGEPMHPVRRSYGYCLCVSCQQALEQSRRR